jgi:starch-binding outer membrane protein, SusD/RagB family
MNTNIKKVSLLLMSIGLFTTSCKDELDIRNPNQPTPASAATEVGVISLAQGSVYINGMGNSSSGIKYYDGVPGGFWTGATGFHELMGDQIGEEAANQFGNQIGMPDLVTLDDGTKIANPSSVPTQMSLLRTVNVNAQGGSNPTYYEWAYMYNLNNGMNSVLDIALATKFTGDAAVKLNTLKAWAYWWKGYAYARIGSIYYAGLINDKSGATNGNYVSKEAIIAESNKNFDAAATALTAIGNVTADYTSVMNGLIPAFNLVGKGLVPTPAMWKRNINTMKARNILVNTTTKAMTAAQWNSILTLANDGIQTADYVFTGRSNSNGDFLNSLTGTIPNKTSGPPASATYKISERLIQDFPVGDKRLANNFNQLAAAALFNADRGNSFNTRFQLVNGGKGMAGVIVYANQAVGMNELYLAGTYEENELMKAEAKINTADLIGGAASIDAVRKYQGAGLDAIASTVTKDAALEELRKERRVALALRGLSFYDARRWEVISNGRTNAVVIDKAGKLNTKASITYNFLDYWDVPDNELKYNPAVSGSAAIKNPK